MNTIVPALILLLLFNTCSMVVGKRRAREINKIGSRRNRLPQDILVEELLRNYNPHQPPRRDRPTEVRLGIYVISFNSINEQSMEYSLNMYLRMSWQDPRLMYTPQNDILPQIMLQSSISRPWDKLWTPDIFFRNEKRSVFHSVMKHNRLMKLNATGHIWYATKLSSTLSCPMKLHTYPMDTQYCSILFESFAYTMDTIYYGWEAAPAQIDPSVELPQHTIAETLLYDCSQNYSAGAFPCLEIRFVLKRNIGYYLMQVYLPSGLTVILSWVSFWIPIDKVAERLSVGLVIILTMTTWSSGIQDSLPRVSYIKSIDVWMSMCLTFVFASVVEVGLVSAISRKTMDSSTQPHDKITNTVCFYTAWLTFYINMNCC